jgi:hypothetical protein
MRKETSHFVLFSQRYAFGFLIISMAILGSCSVCNENNVATESTLIKGVSHSVYRLTWFDTNRNKQEDTFGDSYWVDYGNDGTVDRKVSFNNDETIIEYFDGIHTDPIWMWYISGDHWHLTDFEYSQSYDQWKSEHINGQFGLFKRCSADGIWYPYSENPFFFYDTNGDRLPDVAIRFATMYDKKNDANNYDTIWTPLVSPPDPLLCNLRLSFNLGTNKQIDLPYAYTFSLSVEIIDPINENTYLKTKKLFDGRVIKYILKQDALALTYRLVSGKLPIHKNIGLAYEYDPESFQRWEGIMWHDDSTHNVLNAGGPWFSANRFQDYVPNNEGAILLYTSDQDNAIHMRNSIYSVRTIAGVDWSWSDEDHDGFMEKQSTPSGTVSINPAKFHMCSVDSIFQRVGLDTSEL